MAAPADTPVSKQDFARAMDGFDVPSPPVIAAAVSGGGDSMALALLLHDWATARGGRIVALTVDHGLRSESAAEAETTGAILSAKGIEHEILHWTGDKPQTGLQAAARAARYELLLAACARHGIRHLALAHNLEDQAETFWMRLAHGSGVDGLSGMAAAREEGEVTLLRPVLGFSRGALRATCRAGGVSWAEDPTNGNEKYLRPRLRNFEAELAAEGLTPARLGRTVEKLARSREALEFFAERAFGLCTRQGDDGLTLDPAALKSEPREIQLRVLAAALHAVRVQPYPPRAEALDALLDALLSEGFAGRTLAGCKLSPDGARIRIRPENETALRRSA